jgi:hypothetical protein
MSPEFKKRTVVLWRLGITWSDGQTEGLAQHLPEYLVDELEGVLQRVRGLARGT